ncbi:MAG: YabP/YqfC family sporulation protein [Clostridia bacterium]|nr:YabP/YqfC family sporulation protein [Clostridia bacterium]
MRRKKEFFTRFGERLDIPREALPGGFGLSMSGQNELTVRGCRKILSYGADRISLSLGKVTLTVEGIGLLCTVFEAGSVTVQGLICKIGFDKGRGTYEN